MIKFLTNRRVGMDKETVLRRPERGGSVPNGCYGLELVNGELNQWVESGERLRAREGGQLYWLSPGPWQVTFVPQADAPEIGARVDLVLDPKLPGLSHLIGTRERLGSDELAIMVGRLAGPTLLLPGITREELADARARLSLDLQDRCGIRCEELAVVDLSGTVDTVTESLARLGVGLDKVGEGVDAIKLAALGQSEPAPFDDEGSAARVETSALDRQAMSELAGLAVEMGMPIADDELRAPNETGLPWWRPSALDQGLRDYLSREMEMLATDVRTWRIEQGQKLAPETWQLVSDLEQALRLLAQQVEVLTPLESGLAGLKLSYGQRRAAAVLVRDAVEQARDLRQQVETLCKPANEKELFHGASVSRAMDLARLLESNLRQRQEAATHG